MALSKQKPALKMLGVYDVHDHNEGEPSFKILFSGNNPDDALRAFDAECLSVSRTGKVSLSCRPVSVPDASSVHKIDGGKPLLAGAIKNTIENQPYNLLELECKGGVSLQDLSRKVNDFLYQLDEHKRNSPFQFSHDQEQQVELARAVAHQHVSFRLVQGDVRSKLDVTNVAVVRESNAISQVSLKYEVNDRDPYKANDWEKTLNVVLAEAGLDKKYTFSVEKAPRTNAISHKTEQHLFLKPMKVGDVIQADDFEKIVAALHKDDHNKLLSDAAQQELSQAILDAIDPQRHHVNSADVTRYTASPEDKPSSHIGGNEGFPRISLELGQGFEDTRVESRF